MSIPQHITLGVGGTVSIDALARQASATVDIVTGSGASIVTAAAATVSTVNTTLSADAARGASSVTVASATGIVAGAVVWLQGDPEAVLVSRVSSTTLTLRRPLLKDHYSAEKVEGTRFSYAVSAAAAATLFFDGHVKWTFADGSVEFNTLECTTYPLRRKASLQDLLDRHPKLFSVLDPEVDPERLLQTAFEELLEAIGAKGRARVFPASQEFVRATCSRALKLAYEHVPSDEAKVLFERYEKASSDDLERALAALPRDANQDGAVTNNEALSFRTRSLIR